MKSKADSLIKKTDKPLATVDRGRETQREREDTKYQYQIWKRGCYYRQA